MPTLACTCTRREAIRSLGLIATSALAIPFPVAVSLGADARTPPSDLLQPATPSPGAFMRRAFDMRRLSIERGDQAYGAVVVRAGRIVGEGVSAVITSNDPTAHAEMQGLRDAQRRLGTSDLSGCELFGTSRACPMCEAAAYRARIARMFHGEAIADAGAPRAPESPRAP